MKQQQSKNGNVITVKCEKLQDYLLYVDKLTKKEGDFIFRGQNDSKHRLQDSWRRYSTTPPEEWMTDFSDMLKRFVDGIAINEISDIQLDSTSPVYQKLQIGRHCGLPTPCIDFTYSPYIALYFAFDNISKAEIRSYQVSKKRAKSSVVYAIDKKQLATLWALLLDKPPIGQKSENSRFNEYYNEFLSNDENYFNHDNDVLFPAKTLKLIPYSCENNKRMMRQLGCLLYDTVNYNRIKYKDLEDFISNAEKPKDSEPVMYKFIISHKQIGEVLAKLELMGITGGMLYNSVDGVVADCKNKYFYNSIYMINS